MKLSDINDATLRAILGNSCKTKITLASSGAGTATVGSTGTITYTVDGIFKTKSALSAQSIAVTHDQFGNAVANGLAAYTQPVSTTVYYVLSLNAAGTVAVSQGGYSGQSVTSPAGAAQYSAGGLPVVPAGYTPIGIIKVATGASATFVAGTTNLDAAGVTATFTDVERLPVTAP